jgi:hypothetical protein
MIRDRERMIAKLENSLSNKKKLFFQNGFIFLICGILAGILASLHDPAKWRFNWELAVCAIPIPWWMAAAVCAIPWWIAAGFLFTLAVIYNIQLAIEQMKEGKFSIAYYFRPKSLWTGFGQLVATIAVAGVLQFLLGSLFIGRR